MSLPDHPRRELGVWPTPLVRAKQLEARLGGGRLLVKRDDLSGFAMAGNKTRPLEYLLGAAIAEGCDTLVVGGVATSNFCAGAAVAAQAAGLRCHIVLPGGPPPPNAVNLRLARVCGAQVSFSGTPRAGLDERIQDRAAELRRAGLRAFAIPRGGANALGSLGFVRAATELHEQLGARGYDQARVVLPVGSGGSLAGLLVGGDQQAARWTITGVSVSRPLPALTAHLHSIVDGCADLVGVARRALTEVDLVVAPDGLHGAGTVASAGVASAARLALETEGLILDADYTARAFPVALALLQEPGPPVVFWHTGGVVKAIGDYAFADDSVDANGIGGPAMDGVG
jgi:1-aminocyclopropane-1-carboxylate deaminase